MTSDNESLAVENGKSGLPPLIKAYLIIYALLFAGYVFYAVTASRTISADEFIKTAFPALVQGGGLEQEALVAAFDESKGHLIVAEDIKFNLHGIDHQIPDGNTLTKMDAVSLALAFEAAKKLSASATAEKKEEALTTIKINKYSFSPHVWATLMTLYNLGGIYLAIVVFLRKPVAGVLDKSRKSTAEALLQAQEAQSLAEEIKARYEALIKEVEEEKRQMEANAVVELEEEREHIINTAKHEASGMIESLKESLEHEIAKAKHQLKREVAQEALAKAREIIKAEAGEAEHEQAVTEFMAELKKVKLS
jgi:F-type H+-transporting ATPase subunit b